MTRPLLSTALLSIALLLASCGTPVADSPTAGGVFANVGSLDFPTSAAIAAQQRFLRGVALLHSFGYKQAIVEFKAAQEIEPDFALAYWGEALGYNHPLLPEHDLDSPRQALARLGATREERAAKAPTAREKGFLAAVEALFGDGTAAERRIAYMRAMERLYDEHPEDPEVATFYALSLLSAVGPLGDEDFRLNVQAGAIAMRVFEQNPDHPGAAHYIIHAFDDPVHAPLALPAAWRFAEIAPAVSHARHMPSHIFIQRGMWAEVSKSNDSAFAAAVDLWEPGDSVADMVHSLDWGHYGDLQRGDYAGALNRVAELDRIVERSDRAGRAVRTVPLLWARTVVETEAWETRPMPADARGDELLAIGISAVRTGNLDLAREAEAKLAEIAAKTNDDRSTFARGNKPDQVMRHQVAALVALAEGRTERAIALLDAALPIADGMGPPRGAADPVKPLHELYGDVLLELGLHQRAVELYTVSLERHPNRPLSLRGLARAHAAAGERDAAAARYRRLISVREGRDELTDVQEAKRFIETAET